MPIRNNPSKQGGECDIVDGRRFRGRVFARAARARTAKAARARARAARAARATRATRAVKPTKATRAATGLVHDFAHEIKPFKRAGQVISARPLQIFLGIFKSDFRYMQANLNRK